MLGAVAIVVMLWAPKGIWGLIVERFGWQVFPLERRVVLDDRGAAPRRGRNARRDRRETSTAWRRNGEQGHHHLRDHRLDPHADHVGRAADHAGPDRRRRRSMPPRPAPRSCICTRATPRTAGPSPDPEVFLQFLPRIKQSLRRGDQHHHRRQRDHDGGGAHRRGAPRFSPEMCSLNMGSMNFALYPMATRYKTWKYDWEEQLPAPVRRRTSSATRFATSSGSPSCSARTTA